MQEHYSHYSGNLKCEKNRHVSHYAGNLKIEEDGPNFRAVLQVF